MNNYESLHICFLIFVGDRLYSERELAVRLPEVDRAIADGNVIDIQTPEGTFSMQYMGEELWPPELWTEINLFLLSTHELLKGGEERVGIDGQYASLKLRRMGDRLLYQLQSTPPSPQHDINRVLPFAAFVHEYILMKGRMYKFISYLRKQRFNWHEWYSKYPYELRRLVGDENVQAIVDQDVAEVLSKSPCTQGYYCTADQEFIKVPFGAPNPLYDK